MSDERLMQLNDIPEVCPRCNGELICAKRTFRNGSKHIAALCTTVDCHENYHKDGSRFYASFKHNNGHYISQADLDFIQSRGSEFGINYVDVGPSGEVPSCSYKDCDSEIVEMHHIMPKGYADDADNWPIVPLCPYHHDKWHATLTTGLLRRAASYNWDALQELYAAMEADGFTAYEEDPMWFNQTAMKDFDEALDAAKLAARNSEAAAVRVQKASALVNSITDFGSEDTL